MITNIIFTEQQESYNVGLLIKEVALNSQQILDQYIQYTGIDRGEFIALGLHYNDRNKVNNALMAECIEELKAYVLHYRIQTLYVADANYFKFITKEKKADAHLGYVRPCRIKDLEHVQVILGVNYQAIFHNPMNQEKVTQSLDTLVRHITGEEQTLNTSVIEYEYYPNKYEEIKVTLEYLKSCKELTFDIEAYSLKFWEAGIATIAFSWNEHEGVCFPVDAQECEPYEYQYWCKKDKKYKTRTGYHKLVPNHPVRELLKEFFETYTGNLVAHNITYDAKVLIHTLWSKGLGDNVGNIKGLEVLKRSFDDTRIIAYLALNSCSRVDISLKALTQSYLGNYAESDINDIRLIKLDQLMRYNLLDVLGTTWVKNKYYPKMVQDEQEELYLGLFKESLEVIIHTELSGLPIDIDEVAKLDKTLTAKREEILESIRNSTIVIEASKELKLKKWQEHYEKRREKAKNPDKIKYADWSTFPFTFKPTSGQQVGYVLYEYMKLPVLDTTDTGLPAVGAKEIEKLIHHTDDEDYKALINLLVDFGKLDKIMSSFMPAFKAAPKAMDGNHYLFGNFKLGGTVSGRLSSSEINMQNLPSTRSVYAKPVKKCFKSNSEWLYVGYDFASLEDRISAVTTKDTNKIKVYSDGYCGHCLRAYGYFGEQMPDIVDTVESINSIDKKYPDLRQESKLPTFALTYAGTWITLVRSLGLTEERAKQIEARYHELYKESDDWVEAKLKGACNTGYIIGAFGLKVRTPMLSKVIWDSPSMPNEARKEGRTAGNALGQSWCLLNNRCINAVMKRVYASKYRNDIVPCGQIHDAGYFRVRNCIGAIEFLNTCISEEAQWNDHPDIYHPEVGFSAELDLFPNWAEPITLKNFMTKEQIMETVRNV